MRANTKHNSIKLIMLIGYILSLQPWFLYGYIKTYIIEAIICVLFMLSYSEYKNIFSNGSHRKPFFLCVLAMIAISLSLSFNTLIAQIPGMIIAYFISRLDDSIASESIEYITKWMSRLLAVSLIVHIMSLFVSIPYFEFYPSNGLYATGFKCYIFDIYDIYDFGVTKFQSIFIEPGHMVMGIIPLIIMNKCDLKKRSVQILVLSLLFSLSLAGYITLALIGVYYATIKSSLVKRILYCGIIYLLFQGFVQYTEKYSESALSVAIAQRLIFEDGKLSGDNRVSEEVDARFKKQLTSSEIWFGVSDYDKLVTNSDEHGNQGYKVLVLAGGIVPILFVLFYLFSMTKIYRCTDNYFLSIILALLVAQNFYPFWISITITIFAGTRYIYNNQRAVV